MSKNPEFGLVGMFGCPADQNIRNVHHTSHLPLLINNRVHGTQTAACSLIHMPGPVVATVRTSVHKCHNADS